MINSRLAGALTLALICQSILTVSADARPRHHHRTDHAAHRILRHARHAPNDAERSLMGGIFGGIGRGFAGVGTVVSEARSQIGNGAIYGRSNLWCARFMNFVLEHTGHSGTGSDLAASFARYGQPAAPQVGAIAVMGRRGGGHVGIVSGFDRRGNPIIISGNHGNRVREAVYPRSRIYAYRTPA